MIAFEKFGEIKEIIHKYYPSKTKAKENRGFGFITFVKEEVVQRLLTEKPPIVIISSQVDD